MYTAKIYLRGTDSRDRLYRASRGQNDPRGAPFRISYFVEIRRRLLAKASRPRASSVFEKERGRDREG